MQISDKQVKKLKKILLKHEFEVEIIPAYSGRSRKFKFKGFEILEREEVNYSKNPFIGLKQEISAIFKRREHPPTEYSLKIIKVPHYSFNHLLGMSERIEYPTKLSREKREDLQSEPSHKIMELIKKEVISFFKEYGEGPKREKLPLTDNEREFGHPNLNLECPNCGNILYDTALKCDQCGKWLDNYVFQKLEEDDIELIKARDLVIATPSLISLMLLEPMTMALEEILEKGNENLINQLLFRAYCYSFVLSLTAEMKKSKKDLLKKEINTFLINQALSLIEQIEPDKKITPEAVNHGLYLFSQLDKIDEEFPYSFEDPTPSEFLVANKMGKIIYGDEKTIPLSLKLYSIRILAYKYFEKAFSGLFIVEEEDFNWKKLVD